jgi:hypothetical protein
MIHQAERGSPSRTPPRKPLRIHSSLPMSPITRMILEVAAVYMAAAAVWLGIKLPVLATTFLLGLAWFLVSKWRSQTRRINAAIATLHDEKRWSSPQGWTHGTKIRHRRPNVPSLGMRRLTWDLLAAS